MDSPFCAAPLPFMISVHSLLSLKTQSNNRIPHRLQTAFIKPITSQFEKKKKHAVITSYLLLIKWARRYCHIQIQAAEFNNTKLWKKQLVLDISGVNEDRQTHLDWRGQPRQRKQTKLII